MLSAHVLSLETPFVSWQMMKIVTLIDLHIVLTYDCWHCFLVFNIWVSHALEMTIHFYYPTLELFCFSFIQPFTHSKVCLPNPSMPPWQLSISELVLLCFWTFSFGKVSMIDQSENFTLFGCLGSTKFFCKIETVIAIHLSFNAMFWKKLCSNCNEGQNWTSCTVTID